MYTRKTTPKQRFVNIKINADITECETMERKVEKMLAGKESVDITRNPIYQQRRDGIEAAYNIRADRHEIMREAVQEAANKYWEARDLRMKEKVSESPESTAASNSK